MGVVFRPTVINSLVSQEMEQSGQNRFRRRILALLELDVNIGIVKAAPG